MKKFVTVFVALAMCSPAWAGKELRVVPREAEHQTIRYLKGSPTADVDLPQGAVQVTPLAMDHGKLSFSVVYWNKGAAPVNFGVESIAVTYKDRIVPVLSAEELIKRAKSRAMWTQVAIAMVAGAAAAASATTTDHYRSTTYGPGGRRYSTYGSFTRSNPQAVALYSAAGAAGVYAVQTRLDETRQILGDEVIQTTTVDPDDSYGGIIVLEKINGAKWPAHIVLQMKLGEATYPFTFDVSN